MHALTSTCSTYRSWCCDFIIRTWENTEAVCFVFGFFFSESCFIHQLWYRLSSITVTVPGNLFVITLIFLSTVLLSAVCFPLHLSAFHTVRVSVCGSKWEWMDDDKLLASVAAPCCHVAQKENWFKGRTFHVAFILDLKWIFEIDLKTYK